MVLGRNEPINDFEGEELISKYATECRLWLHAGKAVRFSSGETLKLACPTYRWRKHLPSTKESNKSVGFVSLFLSKLLSSKVAFDYRNTNVPVMIIMLDCLIY